MSSQPASRSASPLPAFRRTPSPLNFGKRSRTINVSGSDLWIAKPLPIPSDMDDSFDTLLSTPPRPAPQPPTQSPAASPDSFRLSFVEKSYEFPHPPLPTPSSAKQMSSPTLSSCSSMTSPGASSSALPATPGSSDDEFAMPAFQPKYHHVRPLSISKRDSTRRPAPLRLTTFAESDDSDSEWYSREFQKILNVSPSPSPVKPSRPESTLLGAQMPLRSKRFSRGFPSSQLDPAFPRSLRRAPSMPARPPPRSSIPMDLTEDDDEGVILEYYYSSPSASESSCSSGSSDGSSPGSLYSQPSPREEDEWEFDFNIEFGEGYDEFTVPQLPLAMLPTSPIDLDAGLEELRARQQHEPSHALRSKWSSSTLGDDQHISPSRKLKAYFSGNSAIGASSRRRGSKSSSASPKSPGLVRRFTPLSGAPRSTVQPIPSTPSPKSPRYDYQMMTMMGAGVKRRGSTTTMSSDAGSVESALSGSSTSSSGLRRKPIPVEMFLRS